MKNAGKARSYGLYRHLRTSKEIIENLLNYFLKKLYFITLQSPDASWKAAPSGNDRPFPDCPVLSVPSL